MSRKRARLDLTVDAYRVAHLEPSMLLKRHTNFAEALQQAIATLRPVAKAAWLTLRGEAEIAHLSHALAQGFRFNHASDLECILSIWLDEKEPSNLPKSPSHTVGVGCIVYSPSMDKVLVVKEKHGLVAGYWKLVTGLVNASESLSQAAQREVEEETGLTNLTFHGIHSFRESHMHVFGKSNLFFLCLLEANESASNVALKPCEREIEETKWMTIDQFKEIPSWPLYREMNIGALDMLREYYGDRRALRSSRPTWLKEQVYTARFSKAKTETLFAPSDRACAPD